MDDAKDMMLAELAELEARAQKYKEDDDGQGSGRGSGYVSDEENASDGDGDGDEGDSSKRDSTSSPAAMDDIARARQDLDREIEMLLGKVDTWNTTLESEKEKVSRSKERASKKAERRMKATLAVEHTDIEDEMLSFMQEADQALGKQSEWMLKLDSETRSKNVMFDTLFALVKESRDYVEWMRDEIKHLNKKSVDTWKKSVDKALGSRAKMLQSAAENADKLRLAKINMMSDDLDEAVRATEQGDECSAALEKGIKSLVADTGTLRRRNMIREGKSTEKVDKVIEEIIKTEQTYVSSLTILVDVFLIPLEQALKSKKAILPSEAIKDIFSNIQVILSINKNLLNELEASTFTVAEVSDIMLRMADFLKVYNVYINDYGRAGPLLNHYKGASKAFREFLQQAKSRKECKGLRLEDFLIMPIQRIPRYMLLLQELVKSTKEKDPNYQLLVKALDKIKEIASYINECKRKAENTEKMLEIQQSLDYRNMTLEQKMQLNLMGQNKVLLRHETLQACPVRGEDTKERPLHMILLNDMLIVAVPLGKSQKRKYANHVYLYDANVTKMDGVRLLLENKADKDAGLTISFESEQHRMAWQQTLTAAIKEAQSKDPPTRSVVGESEAASDQSEAEATTQSVRDKRKSEKKKGFWRFSTKQ